jgi:hypothetical protein
MEDILISEAPSLYGKYFENAYSLVSFVSGFYDKIAESRWVFQYFANQLQNSLFLALLSILRRHDTQANLMLRQSLENIVLAGYAAYNYDPAIFGEISDDDTLVNKDVRTKAYIWIDLKYPTHSVTIKSYKDMINAYSAHANFLSTFSNSEQYESKIVSSFFDGSNEDPEHYDKMIKQRLWWIGNISLHGIDLFAQIINDLKISKTVDGFDKIMQKLSKENDLLKEELAQHPIFASAILAMEGQ